MRLFLSPGPVVAALLAVSSSAQRSEGGTPPSFETRLAGPVPVLALDPPDTAALFAEDAATGSGALRYGVMLPARSDLARGGVWSETADSFVWRLQVDAPGAFSLGLLFERFDLPPGGELFVYTPDRTELLGAFTESTELPHGALPVRGIAGDRLVLEYAHPKSASGTPELVLESVVYDYRDVFRAARLDDDPQPSRRAGCSIDVNCPEGVPYADVKRAVVSLYANGIACTGVLLNNTASDATPYVLTADACGDQTNTVVVFSYERSGCGTGAADNNATLAGATLVARSAVHDAALWLLPGVPPAKPHRPYYAGWNRGDTFQGVAACIHHPAGQPKEIALDSDGADDWGGMWHTDWNAGLLDLGSVGAPLLDGAQRVIGIVNGLTSTGCDTQEVLSGRLREFYTAKGLDQWLDPGGSGTNTTNGYTPYFARSIVYNGLGVNPVIYSSTPPTVGSMWTGTIDARGVQGAFAVSLYGRYSGFSGLVTKHGELLINLGSGPIFESTQPVVNGFSIHTAPIPNDPTLCGQVGHSQGFVLGSQVVATNGVQFVMY